MKRPILLLTRPEDNAQAFVGMLRADLLTNLRIVISPLLEIVQTGVVPTLGVDTSAIFTSLYGVLFAPPGEGRSAYCVGENTRAAALGRGWDVQHVSATAADLVADLKILEIDGPLLHLAGRNVRGDIVKRLTENGNIAHLVTLYDQKLVPLSTEARDAMASGAPIICPLFSPRTAAHFAKEASDLSDVHVIAMSDAVAEALGNSPCASISIADAPTAREMRRCVEKLLSDGGLA